MYQEYAEKQFFWYHWHRIHEQLKECQFLCHDECRVKLNLTGAFLTCYYANKSLGVEGH